MAAACHLARRLRAAQAGIDLRRVHRDALVFTTSRARPQSRRNCLRALHAAGDRCDLNSDGRQRIGLHDLRHSLIAAVLVGTGDLDVAAAVARHANPNVTTSMYVGLTDSRRAGIAQRLTDAGQIFVASHVRAEEVEIGLQRDSLRHLACPRPGLPTLRSSPRSALGEMTRKSKADATQREANTSTL